MRLDDSYQIMIMGFRIILQHPTCMTRTTFTKNNIYIDVTLPMDVIPVLPVSYIYIYIIYLFIDICL